MNQSQPYTTESLVRTLWTQSLGGWAHQMIIKNSIVYSSWTGGTLSAIELKTGKVLNTAANVAYETAPIVVNDKIYSYTFGRLTELDLNSFTVLRKMSVFGGEYSEYIPYDTETDCFYLRRSDGTGENSFVSALNRINGQYVWTSPSLAKGIYVVQSSPLIAGPHLIAPGLENNSNYIICLDKITGNLIWKTTNLGYSTRSGYNNLCYDKVTDVLFGSTMNANIFALERKTGKIIWQRNFNGYGCWSTLSYNNKQLIAPLWRSNANGKYVSLNAENGQIQWEKNEFFGADGWSAVWIGPKYIYRTTHSYPGNIVIQNRTNGDLVWSADESPQPCTNPVASGGIVLFGTVKHLTALKVGGGQFLDCPWHGMDCTGYLPNSIQIEYAGGNNNTSTTTKPPEV